MNAGTQASAPGGTACHRPVATGLWLGNHGGAQTVSRPPGLKREDVAGQATHDTGADFRIDGAPKSLIPTW